MIDAAVWIIAAMEFEVRPLIRRLGLRFDRKITAERPEGRVWRGGNVQLIVTGMGGQRAAGGLSEHLGVSRPQRVIIVGLSGALDPALKAADVLRPAQVIDAATGQTFQPTEVEATSGRLLSVNEIAGSPAAKAALRGRFGADLIDMESASLARVCRERGIAWSCVRAISDEAHEALPTWLGDCVANDGSTHAVAFMRHMFTDPVGGWTVLVKMTPNARRAAVTLADAVAKYVAAH